MIAKARGQLHAVLIITEYAQGGDLLKLLLRKDTPLGWRFRIQIAKEVCAAEESGTQFTTLIRGCYTTRTFIQASVDKPVT